MTTRVATYASRQVLINRLLDTQKRMETSSIQVTTQKKAQQYQGIASDSFRLVNFENELSQVQRFIDNNKVASIRLSTMNTTVTSADDTMRDMRSELIDFQSRDLGDWSGDDEQAYVALQRRAFDTMKAVGYFMNVNIDGRYLFSGASTSTQPVNLPWDTLEQFQTTYDGLNVTYGETRAATLSKISISASMTTGHNTAADRTDLTNTQLGTVTYDPAGTINASTPGAFKDMAMGETITITGGPNAGTTFTIDSVSADGQTLNVTPPPVAGSAAAGVSMSHDVTYGTLSAADGTFITGTLTDDAFGVLTTAPGVDGATGTFSTSKSGAFSNLTAGTTLLLDQDAANGAALPNDGIYTVISVSADGRSVTVEPPPPAAVIDGPGTGTSPEIRIGLPEGAPIKLSNSASNGGYYAVHWPTGLSAADTTAVINGALAFVKPDLAPGTVTENVKIETLPYYQGDQMTFNHRLDTDRTISVGANAGDPAIEKALRAMGIISQGLPVNGAGSPDIAELTRRLDSALELINDCLEHKLSSPEAAGDLKGMSERIGYNLKILDASSEQQGTFAGFLQTRTADMENVNPAEAIMQLQNDANSLEVSYSALSTIMGLSLVNYI